MSKLVLPATLICNGADIDIEMTVGYTVLDGEIVVQKVLFGDDEVELTPLAYEQIALEIEELL